MTGARAEAAVSIVIPIGRVDADLDEQLRAVAAQELDQPFEVVLVLNTTDPAARVALDRAVAALDDRFRVVEGFAGAPYARNVGAAAAKGDVLAFCDADDVVHPGWLAAMVRAVGTDDAVGGRLIDIGQTERQRKARPPATPDALPTFLGVPYIGSGNLAVTKAAFDAVGGFDEDLVRCEDIAISWQLLAHGSTLGFVSDACIDYRHRPGVRRLVEQHFHYGRGMAQVLVRYGVPEGDGWSAPKGASLLRPNSGTGGSASLLGVLRRGALAAGRVVGIVEEKVRQRRGAKAGAGARAT